MANEITPAEIKTIQVANHEQVAKTTESVLDMDRQLQQSNTELALLNESLCNLKKTLDKNDELKGIARARMQKLVTRI